MKPMFQKRKDACSYGAMEEKDTCSFGTFKYIVLYKTTNEKFPRLLVAMGDFVFTQKELDTLTITEMVEELLARA
jgi:hypothetical protein